jgi:hypothetical protein
MNTGLKPNRCSLIETELTGLPRGIRTPVIPPFLKRPESRDYASKASFCFGVMPPMAMLGRS